MLWQLSQNSAVNSTVATSCFADEFDYQIFVVYIVIQAHRGYLRLFPSIFSRAVGAAPLTVTYCAPPFDILKRKERNVRYVVNMCFQTNIVLFDDTGFRSHRARSGVRVR